MTDPREAIKGQAEASQAVNPRELYSEIKTCQHSIDANIATLATHVQEQALSLFSEDKRSLGFEAYFANIKGALEDQISGDKDQQWENTLKTLIEAWGEYQSPEHKIRVFVQPSEDNQEIAIKFFDFQLYGINIEFEINNSKIAEEIIKFRISSDNPPQALPTVERNLPIEDKLLLTEAVVNAIQSFFPGQGSSGK